MKKFFIFFFSILVIFALFLIFENLRKRDFIGKETLKKIYFSVKKKHLINKYSSCFIDKDEKKIVDKKILIAGHTYGYPADDNLSTYPKFLTHLNKTTKDKYNVAFLAGDIIKTGDVIDKSNKKLFLQVKKELSVYFENIYIAPGNHDVGLGKTNEFGRNEFLSVFKEHYQKIQIGKNLFLILDSTIESGNISQDQINFIKEALKNTANIKNIFIITHHVIWQNYTDEKVLSNTRDDFFDNNNFKNVISLFKKLEDKINIFFVAGDIGVLKQKTLVFCEKKDNFYFIATGMGNKRLDNYLKILISANDEILSIKPIFF